MNTYDTPNTPAAHTVNSATVAPTPRSAAARRHRMSVRLTHAPRRLVWPVGSTWPSETAMKSAPHARVPRW